MLFRVNSTWIDFSRSVEECKRSLVTIGPSSMPLVCKCNAHKKMELLCNQDNSSREEELLQLLGSL